ncbi:LCP family protein [Clostridium sp. NSJ-6]|uniref:LCP family protein n=1 Tax=Clostridium hominis TaxID=2763036 RepID=A0ABR7DB23_9CLOT|nr:LCP family protein [Clostridium hominis]MBC5628083.1 LCP family protein [Clostridium hominis]
MGEKHSENKKINPWIKGSLIVGSILICILLIGAFTVYRTLGKMQQVSVDTSDLNINYEEIQEFENHEEIINIALFGIDSEDGVAGRSDAIMVATIDPIHNKLKLTSIMRDSYVNIPDRGMDKINHAYAFGGPQLAIKTINENFGLDITDYMSVNFTSLPVIIDILGGVEINITDEEVPHIPGVASAGTYTLNGDQALSYSRIRYASGGDYVRTERQRTVLNALFNKASTLSVTALPGLLNEVLPHVQTSMNTSDILALGTKALGAISNGLAQDRFPRDGYCEGTMIDGIYYLAFDQATAKEQMMNYIFDDVR